MLVHILSSPHDIETPFIVGVSSRRETSSSGRLTAVLDRATSNDTCSWT